MTTGFGERVQRFHREQKFIFLFYSLLLLLLLSPIIEESFWGKEIGAILQTLVFFIIIYTNIDTRSILVFIMGMVVIALTSLWWEYTFQSAGAALATCISAAGLCFFLDFTIFRSISWDSAVTRNKIYGALSMYLLLGFGYGYLFAIIDLLRPGSFANVSPFQTGKFSVVTYWEVSFQSLTSLGYLDAAPMWGVTRTLAVMEAIMGQLFLVVMVAMLVGMRTSELIMKRRQEGM